MVQSVAAIFTWSTQNHGTSGPTKDMYARQGRTKDVPMEGAHAAIANTLLISAFARPRPKSHWKASDDASRQLYVKREAGMTMVHGVEKSATDTLGG